MIRHPLQPFDARTVTPGDLGTPGDPSPSIPPHWQGACAAAGPRRRSRHSYRRRCPRPPRRDIDLAALIALLTHPAKGFLKQRLDVGIRYEEDDPSDALPVELDALEKWGVGNRLLRDRLAGISEADCRQAEWRRGVLPPGPLGVRALEDVMDDLRPLVDRTAELRAKPRRSVDVTATLEDGRQLRGTVSGLHDTTLVGVSFSKLGAAARLKAWINVVALTAADPDTPWAAATVGRGRVGKPQCATLTPLTHQQATEVLEQLVELYELGLREPLPIPIKSAAEYALTRFGGADPPEAHARAKTIWTSGKYPGEDDDGAHLQVWGRRVPFDTLLTALRPDEVAGGEPDRFAELATRLWFPLLEHEQRAIL